MNSGESINMFKKDVPTPREFSARSSLRLAPCCVSMKPSLILSLLLTSVLAFAAGAKFENSQATGDIESRIYRKAEAKKSSGDWGSIFIYTADGTSTYGTDNMLTAELEFLPGKQLQPPHQHANEEFQYVIEGNGTWTLNGKEIPLEKGDLMYAKPWDMHGIRNTGTEPLKFFVFKWTNKGMGKPVQATGK
jgi:mannose-6-phosphate isomerase-like protein (cupin superfamily)